MGLKTKTWSKRRRDKKIVQNGEDEEEKGVEEEEKGVEDEEEGI